MSEIVIDVQHLSKMYKLGSIGSHSLRQDISHWWQRTVLKKEETPIEDEFETDVKKQPYIWALKDVSFTVKQGESLGIIGSNGSGKSTLLKVIARIVQPTSGAVRGRGKISSILEVGTGFHQELTGRENIYTSGYILGMSKSDIKSKFDEIVAFSGVEKFIDTPVKRYSSGMYVRLAFAVAAHLEPDILIVDEVLAVGDAEFQKKCMGRMQQVSDKEGRTVLFVSHNMQAVSNLCSHAIWLHKGKLRDAGQAHKVIHSYISSFKQDADVIRYNTPDKAPGNKYIKLKSVFIHASNKAANDIITVNTPVEMNFEFWCYLSECNLNINVILTTDNGICVFNMGTKNTNAGTGELSLKSYIPAHLLNNKTYYVSLKVIKNNSTPIYEFENCASFEVEDVQREMAYYGEWPGVIRPQIESHLLFKESAIDKDIVTDSYKQL